MSSKTKKPREFANAIFQQLDPVNQKQRFKEKFKDYENFRLVINASDARYAALVKIDHSVLTVEGIRKSDKSVVKNLKKECDGYLEMTLDLFYQLVKGDLSGGAMARKWLARKIKVKGMKNVSILNKLFYYTTDNVK